MVEDLVGWVAALHVHHVLDLGWGRLGRGGRAAQHPYSVGRGCQRRADEDVQRAGQRVQQPPLLGGRVAAVHNIRHSLGGREGGVCSQPSVPGYQARESQREMLNAT